MRKWLIVALSLLWLVWELISGLDRNPDTWPLTKVIIEYVPWPLTFAAIAALVIWLPIHFWSGYRQHRVSGSYRQSLIGDPLMADPVAPAPNDDRREPLLTRAAIMAAATAALGLLVSFKVITLTDLQRDLVLTALGVGATMIAAWWARRHVYAPATVARLLAAKPVTPPTPPTRRMV